MNLFGGSAAVSTAFVTFPSGNVTIDPNGAFQAAGRLIKTTVQPSLYGFGPAATFTRRYGRWLPAGLAAVSPDSSHYAYSEFTDASYSNTRIHVVDVTSALDRVVSSQGSYAVIDYEAEGIYLVQTYGEDQRGLWLIDPVSGSLIAVGPPDQFFYLVGGGAAWTGDVAPGDQAPHALEPMDRILRFDLKTRTVTPWFRRPGLEVRAIGFGEQQHLVVEASSEESLELWLVSGPGVAREIYSGPGAPDSPDFGTTPPLADSHGLWLGTSRGIYLYTLDGNFRQVSTAHGAIAGRCS